MNVDYKEVSAIKGYHAHVYYDQSTIEQARQLCQKAAELFGVSIGFMHERPVGPHPMWSCQLTVTPEKFAHIVPWLALNRNGMTIFVHAETGDDLRDHTEHVMWIGREHTLNLSIFY